MPTSTPLAELIHVLKRKDAIVIAGTGVTASTVPSNALVRSWPALLEHGIQYCCQHCQDEEEISEQCRLFRANENAPIEKLLEIGDEIQRYLVEKGLMKEWLDGIFRNISKEDERVIVALQKLGIPIATTNYDHLFEEITRQDAISWRDPTKLHAYLRGDIQAILHLHGHYRDPESIVLGQRSYQDLLEQEFAQFIQHSLFARNHVVFVGFGDSTKDPNFSLLLRWAKKFLPATKLFRIIRENELDRLRQEQQEWGFDIQLIPYGTAYSDLIPFLEGLAAQMPRPVPIPERLPGCPDCVGRGDLIEDVAAYLVADDSRPVCLNGSGGMGKTNLILNVLYHRKVAVRFSERRYFVNLEGVQTMERFWSQLALDLNVRLQADQPPHVQIERFLSQAPTLLVLDNFETPWNQSLAALEEALLRFKKLADLRLVVTYRGSDKPGRRIGWKELTVEQLEPGAARTLFLQLAGEQYNNDPDLPDLLRSLGYWPLAIELMAKRTEDYPKLHRLQQEWVRKKTDLLRLNPGDKQADLETSILLSFDSPRVSDEARDVFKAFCWLPAGLNRTDWEAAYPERESALLSLFRVGLVKEDPTTGRVTVLPPVRELILHKYPAQTAYQNPLAQRLLALVGEHAPQVGTAELPFKKLQAEWSNLVLLFRETSFDEEQIQALVSLTFFARFTGLSLQSELRHAEEISQQKRWVLSQANCLRSLGDLAYTQSENEEAERLYQQACRSTGRWATCRGRPTACGVWVIWPTESRKMKKPTGSTSRPCRSISRWATCRGRPTAW